MTNQKLSDTMEIYMRHVDQPYGEMFIEEVCRFQERFLRDKVGDMNETFVMSVHHAVRSIQEIKRNKRNAA